MGRIVEGDNSILVGEMGGLRMFVGDFLHSLDPKRRLTIPAVWRSQAGEPKSLFVMPDFHSRCLNVFPASEMAMKLEKLRSHSMADKKAMEFARALGSASDLVSWDGQGRIRIQDKLLRFANLTDQIRMIGALNKFQIWNPADYKEPDEIDQVGLAEAGSYVNF